MALFLLIIVIIWIGSLPMCLTDVNCESQSCVGCLRFGPMCSWCSGPGKCFGRDDALALGCESQECGPNDNPTDPCQNYDCITCITSVVGSSNGCMFCPADNLCVNQVVSGGRCPSGGRLVLNGDVSFNCVSCSEVNDCQPNSGNSTGTCVSFNKCQCPDEFKRDANTGCARCQSGDGHPDCPASPTPTVPTVGGGFDVTLIAVSAVAAVLLLAVVIGIVIVMRGRGGAQTSPAPSTSRSASSSHLRRRVSTKSSLNAGRSSNLHVVSGNDHGHGVIGGPDADLITPQSLGHGILFRPIDRETAERDMSRTAAGTYVVRPSTKSGCLSLSYKSETGQILHILLMNKSRSGWHKDGSEQRFATVRQLLASLPLGLRLDAATGAGVYRPDGGGKTKMDQIPDVLGFSPKFSVRALFSCEPDAPDELAFAEGEIIEIIDDQDSEWWIGKKGQIVGNLPCSYVQRF